MSVIITIIAVIAVIFLFGAIWGKVERAQNRRRADSVHIPDTPLNDVRVSSGVADSILSGQFENDISMYRFYFNTFLIKHLGGSIKARVAGNENQSAMDVMQDEIFKYEKHAVVKGGKSDKDWPNSFAKLLKADGLSGETGIITRNAIIFSIAMCTVTTTQTTWMKDLIGGTSRFVGASNTKTPEEYEEYMHTNHPRATAIAESASHIESQKVAQKIVAMMGYFIDKAQAGGPDETERERGLRIFDEKLVSM